MGLFTKKSAEDRLREQKYKKFAELEKMFEGDSERTTKFQSDWLAGRARHLMQQGDTNNAMHDFNDALKLDRKNLGTMLSYSATLRYLEQTDKAEKVFVEVDDRKQLEEDPISLFNYYVEWGTVLWLNEKDSDALKKLAKAIKVSEQNERLKEHAKFAEEAQKAGLDIDASSFDLTEDIERVKRMIAEIKTPQHSPKHIAPKTKKTTKSTGGKKEISIDGVASGFSGVFLENIDEYREALIKLIVENEKLIVTQDKARAILFYTFLTFWTLPLFNLFDKQLANNMFHEICLQVAKAYETDNVELEKMTLDLRDYYNAVIVENMQRMKGSAWFMDNLVKDSNILFTVQVDAFMTDSVVFDWKKLSEEYEITKS